MGYELEVHKYCNKIRYIPHGIFLSHLSLTYSARNQNLLVRISERKGLGKEV